ncbi:MAG: hypothetical protein Q7S27_05445 [Nanoarchaeota archaeon]|nr:hypothetical protein [Nanoarchaeota archaeon]
MSLSSVIQEIRDNVPNLDNMEEVLKKRVKLPNREGEINSFGLSNHNYYSEDREKNPHHHIDIMIYPVASQEELETIAQATWQAAQKETFPKKTASCRYKLAWGREDFLNENHFPHPAEFSIFNYTTSKDPLKNRFEQGGGNSNNININLENNVLTIESTGWYRQHMRGLAILVGAQSVELHITREDAERLIKEMDKTSLPRILKNVYKKALTLSGKEVIKFSPLSGGIDIEKDEEILISIPAISLSLYEEILGKSLSGPKYTSSSHITQFRKLYGFFSKGKQIKDLQNLAEQLPKLDTGLMYDYPLITNQKAKIVFDEELQKVIRCCDNEFHNNTEGYVKWLAEDQFGEELVKIWDRLSLSDSIEFLKVKGYQPNETFEKVYHDSSKKENHLIAFVAQAYAKNPEPAIESCRNWYQNKSPKTDITARVSLMDAFNISKHVLSPKARLRELKLETEAEKGYQNSIWINSFMDKQIYFSSRISIDRPRYLDVQNAAYKTAGFSFT